MCFRRRRRLPGMPDRLIPRSWPSTSCPALSVVESLGGPQVIARNGLEPETLSVTYAEAQRERERRSTVRRQTERQDDGPRVVFGGQEAQTRTSRPTQEATVRLIHSLTTPAARLLALHRGGLFLTQCEHRRKAIRPLRHVITVTEFLCGRVPVLYRGRSLPFNSFQLENK